MTPRAERSSRNPQTTESPLQITRRISVVKLRFVMLNSSFSQRQRETVSRNCKFRYVLIAIPPPLARSDSQLLWDSSGGPSFGLAQMLRATHSPSTTRDRKSVV